MIQPDLPIFGGQVTLGSGAVIRGSYRYRLHRVVGDSRFTALFIMVNPSTADGAEDDATIRKLKGFAKVHGWGRILVGNLFAWRSTDVKELAKVQDPVGPDNDAFLEAMIREADVVIVAWGSAGTLPPALRGRWRQVTDLAVKMGHPRLFQLGGCGDGHPRHPLMTSYTEPLTLWDQDKAR
jgi:hypothetical protein